VLPVVEVELRRSPGGPSRHVGLHREDRRQGRRLPVADLALSILFEDALDRCRIIREHVAECAPDDAVVDEALLVGHDVPHALHVLPLDCRVLRNETVFQA
jgi:hypothetical protein